MTGYTKLFGSIVASTIWREDDKTRLVWITMLAIANRWGVVEASVPGLADLARVTIKECQAALVKLEAEDEFSRTKDFDGRRIEEVPGGWHILNHAKYRAKMGADERREYNRLKQREHRSRVNPVSANVKDVNDSQPESALSAHTEAEAQAEAQAKAGEPPPKAPRLKRSRSKSDKSNDPRHHEITSKFGAVYESILGRTYPFDRGKDPKCLERFLSGWSGPTEEFFQTAKVILENGSNPFAKWCRASQTICGMCNNWAAVNSELDCLLAPQPQTPQYKNSI